MKIMILNGSPKRDASDTMHMTRAFVEGINETAENAVHTIHVIDRHIEYCTGCFSCMKNGGKCIHNDDMKELMEELPEYGWEVKKISMKEQTVTFEKY